MLEIKNLKVKIGKKEIIKGINLSIPRGKIYFLFGPNGSGKSTLLMALLGFSRYKTEGKIIFKGKDISRLPINKRVKMGISLAFQKPPAIEGLSFKDLIFFISKKEDKDKIFKLAKKIDFLELLEREINKGLSGGEMKRGEIFQALSQNPDFLLLDEPESGVDIENVQKIGKILKEFLMNKNKSALIITHSGEILNYLKGDLGFVMVNGKIVCSGRPDLILKTIKERGYKKCIKCHKKHPNNPRG